MRWYYFTLLIIITFCDYICFCVRLYFDPDYVLLHACWHSVNHFLTQSAFQELSSIFALCSLDVEKPIFHWLSIAAVTSVSMSQWSTLFVHVDGIIIINIRYYQGVLACLSGDGCALPSSIYRQQWCSKRNGIWYQQNSDPSLNIWAFTKNNKNSFKV